jgi:hypothetical protein
MFQYPSKFGPHSHSADAKTMSGASLSYCTVCAPAWPARLPGRLCKMHYTSTDTEPCSSTHRCCTQELQLHGSKTSLPWTALWSSLQSLSADQLLAQHGASNREVISSPGKTMASRKITGSQLLVLSNPERSHRWTCPGSVQHNK